MEQLVWVAVRQEMERRWQIGGLWMRRQVRRMRVVSRRRRVVRMRLLKVRLRRMMLRRQRRMRISARTTCVSDAVVVCKAMAAPV